MVVGNLKLYLLRCLMEAAHNIFLATSLVSGVVMNYGKRVRTNIVRQSVRKIENCLEEQF